MSEERYDLDTVRENISRELVRRRGDSFDIGELTQGPQEQDMIVRIMQNPTQLQDLLNINEEQAENIRAVLVGAGAGVSTKYLSKHFGSSVAGAFGAFLSGIIADKIMKGR